MCFVSMNAGFCVTGRVACWDSHAQSCSCFGARIETVKMCCLNVSAGLSPNSILPSIIHNYPIGGCEKKPWKLCCFLFIFMGSTQRNVDWENFVWFWNEMILYLPSKPANPSAIKFKSCYNKFKHMTGGTKARFRGIAAVQQLSMND